MTPDDRHSEALEAELVADPEEKAHREAKNVLRQFDSAMEQIEFWTPLRPSAIMGSVTLAAMRPFIALLAGILALLRTVPTTLTRGALDLICPEVREKFTGKNTARIGSLSRWLPFSHRSSGPRVARVKRGENSRISAGLF